MHELDCGGPAALELLLLVRERRRRQHDAVDVAHRIFQRLTQSEFRTLIVLGHEMSVHVTGADADFEHDGRVGRLGQFETLLDHAHERGQIGSGVEQPDLRLQGEGVAALLHDRGAFAIILADDDEGAAGDAARGEIGQRIGGDVGARRRFPGHRAA